MAETFIGFAGNHWALLGAGLAFIGGAIGSVVGITLIANVGAGILSEDPEKFGRLLPIIAMPGTQGIYGFITAFLIWIFFLRDPKILASAMTGFQVFLASLPVAVTCLFSGWYQGRASTGAAGMVARRPESGGRAIILPALVETYAVLALIISILLLLNIAGRI